MAIAVVVHEGAAGSPARLLAGDTSFFANVGEGAVAIVVIQNILTVVGDEEVIEAVVVVIADADALSPTGTAETGFVGDVGEGAVTIVLEEVRARFLAFGEAFQTRAVYDKDVEPAVVVVIVEGNSAAGRLEQIFVLVLSAKDGFGIQARFRCDINETHA